MSGTIAEGDVRTKGQLYLGPVLIPRSQLVVLFALVALLLGFSTWTPADTSRVSGDTSTNLEPSQTPRKKRLDNNQSVEEAQANNSRGAAAFEAKDFAQCEVSYLAAARLGVTSITASSLHRASQCAARRGDFRMGLFHLHAAASAGFDDFLFVRSDPLMRPLHSDARWTLVLDLIKNNYLSVDVSHLLLCEHVQRGPNQISRDKSSLR